MLGANKWLTEEWEIDGDMRMDEFACTADAVFQLYEELCCTQEPSREKVFAALYFLTRHAGMPRISFELEDRGPECLSIGK